jgi:hypothetical protein
MPKVTELFAFVVADQDQDDEGVMAFLSGNTWLPMVGADIKKIEALRPIADSISRQMGKPYRVVRFRAVEEIELQGPPRPIDGLVFDVVKHEKEPMVKDSDTSPLQTKPSGSDCSSA